MTKRRRACPRCGNRRGLETLLLMKMWERKARIMNYVALALARSG
jgi:hypothetical protein